MNNFVYNGQFLQVKEEHIENQIFEKVFYKNAIIVFPITDTGKILFIKEKRIQETPPIRIKPVTGFFEEELTWQENTQKELQEEIDLRADHLELFYHHKSTGGFNTEKFFSIATGLKKSSLPNPDGDVIEEIIEFTIEEAIEQSLSDKIKINFDTLGLFIMYHRNDLRKKYGY